MEENEKFVNARKRRFAGDVVKSFAISAASAVGAACGLAVVAIIASKIFKGDVNLDTPPITIPTE